MKAEANPNTIVYFNNEYMELRDAQVSILNARSALWHGRQIDADIWGYCGRSAAGTIPDAPDRPFPALEAETAASCVHRDLPASGAEMSCAMNQRCTVVLLRETSSARISISGRWLTSVPSGSGFYPDDQNALSIIAMPFGDYLPSEERTLRGRMSSWR